MRSFLLVSLVIINCIFSNPLASQKREFKSVSHLKKPKKTLPADNNVIRKLLSANHFLFDSLTNNKKYHIKIIYSQINRNAANKPAFTDYYFNADSEKYFYPASTVKMPAAVLALQKIHELGINGLDMNTSFITERGYSGQDLAYNDPDSEDGRPTIANYIKKIFLVSDNNSFNRLYEFLGQEYINKTLQGMGFKSAEIIHRLNISLTEDENRHTNPVSFYDANGKIIYHQPLGFSKYIYATRKDLAGKGYYKNDRLINEPFDFSMKNRFTLGDLHTVLKMILFPETFPQSKRFNLTSADYSFLYRYMSMKPQESAFPQYDTSYNDAYSKFLLYGGKGKMDQFVRIFNKEGDAYGYLTDIAYIVDFKNNIEFMLSATILCNSNEIFNDDVYDYEQTGFPFMKNLGKVIMAYELNRKRKHKPDLSKFKISYAR